MDLERFLGQKNSILLYFLYEMPITRISYKSLIFAILRRSYFLLQSVKNFKLSKQGLFSSRSTRISKNYEISSNGALDTGRSKWPFSCFKVPPFEKSYFLEIAIKTHFSAELLCFDSQIRFRIDF